MCDQPTSKGDRLAASAGISLVVPPGSQQMSGTGVMGQLALSLKSCFLALFVVLALPVDQVLSLVTLSISPILGL